MSLILLFSLVAPILAANLPANAAALKAQRDKRIEKINRIYADELGKLQKLAMRDGNLTAATAIEEEIARVIPNPLLGGDDSLRESLKGTSWKRSDSEWVIVFRADGTTLKSWGVLTPRWSVKNDYVLFESTKLRVDGDRLSMTGAGGKMSGKWLREK